MSKTPTIGLFVSSSQNGYETSLYRGAWEVAGARGANLICFTSGALRAFRGFEFQRNVLYDLVSQAVVDGLLVSGTLSHPVGMDEMIRFFQRYQGIPIVTIALSVPGHPSVMVDSQQGIRAVVTHLVEEHRCQRIGFLRGPAGQPEADERFQAYLDTLKALGREVDPALVLQGDYSMASGAEAMQKYLARGIPNVDAFVCANDTMAIGAGEVVRRAGYRIPEDIALTGFDDAVEGRFDIAPLTSVRQNIPEQGSLAASMLLEMIAGKAVPMQVKSPAVLIVRRSCGCKGAAMPTCQADIRFQPTWKETLQAQRNEFILLFQLCLPFVHLDQIEKWVDQWVFALIEDILAGEPTTFLQTIEGTQLDALDYGVDVPTWQRTITAFFNQADACLSRWPLIRKHGQVLHAQALLLVGEIAEKIDKRRQFEQEMLEIALREISETMSTTFRMREVLDVLAGELPRLRIESCYLALFEDPKQPAENARLIFGWRNGERVAIPENGEVFPSRNLLPARFAGVLASSGLVVEALYSKDDRLGFALLETSPGNIAVCNALRSLLSGALQGVLLLEQRQKVEAALLHSQEQLKSLVAELELANREMESFTYSVSHDLRAPLRALIGFSTMLVQEFETSLDAQGQAWLQRIIQNAQRMAVLIDELLSLSRVGRQEIHLQDVRMNQLVAEVITEQAEQNPERQIEWVVRDLPDAHGDLVLLRQVWANLVSNAVKYTSRCPRARIEITGESLGDQVKYSVCDNGVGFDMQYAGKLFGVFQRLHTEDEFPGEGVGLAIAQRIVTRLGGQMWAQAQPGQGAAFYFTLPRSLGSR